MVEMKKSTFDVYLLGVYLEEGGWQENERHLLGNVEVATTGTGEIDEVDILTAMKRFTYPDFFGCGIMALATIDRRIVYAEDYYGDGQWWEIGAVKGHVPVYGLKLKEDYE